VSALAFALIAALAQGAPPEPGPAHSESAAVEAHGPSQDAPEAHGAAPASGHQDPGVILMHHVVDERWGHLYIGGVDFGLTKHMVFFGAAALLLIVLIRLALRGYERGVPRGLTTAVESLVLFVRDEIAEKNIGHDGRKYVPLLLSAFFFILTAAFLGLMPFSATSTGNVSVTLGMATVSFLAMQHAGISKNGVVGHFKGLVPPGLPFFLVPIMIPIEIISMFTKPFALTVRLFANMLAGHMVITALLMLPALTAAISTAFGIAMVPVSLGLALFVMVLEVLVAFIQAFIFTLLTAIFIGMYAHPAH
jgi:F-type H+-transporting ATPase subunit a